MKKNINFSCDLLQYGDEYASDFLVLTPESRLTDTPQKMTVSMTIDEDAYDPELYRSTQDTLGTWVKLDAQVSGQSLAFQYDRGGVFVVRSHSNYGPIIGIVVACVAVVVLIVAVVIYFRRNPERWMALKKSKNYLERSMQEKV